MAAVAGDAGNINKQARNARADWVKSPGRAKWVNDVNNKQAADGRPLRTYSLGPSGGRPRRLAPRTGPSTLHVRTDHVVPTIAVVGSLVM